MAAGSTYTKVASYTMPSNGNTVTFSSISQAYTDLRLIINGASTTTADFRIRVGNGSADSGTNYFRTYGFAYGADQRAGGSIANETSVVSTLFTYNSTIIVEMNSYTNGYRKTFLARNNSATDFSFFSSTLWNSTSIINYIQITNPSYNFTTGTTFNLYGILAA